MSKQKAANPSGIALRPMIGSLLRLPREHVVARLLAQVNASGFDVSQTELGVFMYPGPDGKRPSELAKQCNMSRQAMNYVIAGLETRGYIERRPGRAASTTVLHMTPKSQKMYALMRDCVAVIEQEWKTRLGEARFDALCETLYDLSTWLGKVDQRKLTSDM